MAKDDLHQPAITPAESLDSLPQIPFDPGAAGEEPGFRRTELLQSVLMIARVDHIAESKLVRDAVHNALGRVPQVEE